MLLEIIKRITFILMSIFMVFVFWDVIFGPGVRSIYLILSIILGCLIIGIIDIFTES